MSVMTPYSPRNDPRNTEENTSYYWCGYVHMDRDVTDRDVQCMDRHVECTWDRERVIGFDCCHAGDYPLHVDDAARFKDFAHVKCKLLAIIDDIAHQ